MLHTVLTAAPLLTTTTLAAAPQGSYEPLFLVGVVVIVGWLISVWRNPFAPCRWCNGKPRTTGVLFVRAFDLCRHCNGSGRRVRPAARMFPRNYDVK